MKLPTDQRYCAQVFHSAFRNVRSKFNVHIAIDSLHLSNSTYQMLQCQGHRKWFHPRGHSNHLKQMRDRACREVFDQSLRDLDLYDSEEMDDNGGDDEEEEEDLLYDGDEHWEAPVPDQTEMEMDILDEPRFGLGDGDDQQEEPHVHRAREVRWAAEEEFRKAPVVVPFPSTKAGAPIANDRAVPEYDSYQKDLNNQDNHWAPFSSQLDWEVARWAKLRGPSSTAFTELLKIDGVSA